MTKERDIQSLISSEAALMIRSTYAHPKPQPCYKRTHHLSEVPPKFQRAAMEIRLQMPSSPPLDFNIHSGRSSSPSTPKPFRDHFLFLSAPTSPNRSSELHRELDDFSLIDQSSADADADDFAFHVGGGIQTPSASAEELFDGGRIRALNAPANNYSSVGAVSPPESPAPLKSKEKKSFWSQITSRKKKQSNTESSLEKTEEVRGRNRASAPGNRGARSLSPIRVSKYPWEEEKKAPETNTSTALTLSTTSKSSSRRWRLRDLLLFRSASEGRAADNRDPLRKMTALYSRQQEIKSSSFGSVSRRGRVSAHERHYALKKAVSDDMKKKTFLPYKQGILGSFGG